MTILMSALGGAMVGFSVVCPVTMPEFAGVRSVVIDFSGFVLVVVAVGLSGSCP